jgi:hypothetical protein
MSAEQAAATTVVGAIGMRRLPPGSIERSDARRAAAPFVFACPIGHTCAFHYGTRHDDRATATTRDSRLALYIPRLVGGNRPARYAQWGP